MYVVNQRGGSLKLAITSGQLLFPEYDPYSESVREMIRYLIVPNCAQRPQINEVMSKLDAVAADSTASAAAQAQTRNAAA